MRLVRVRIPAGKRPAVTETLDDAGVGYTVTDDTSDGEPEAVVTFPLPTAAVEPVLEDLREVGIDESTYTVVIDVETVISEAFEELADAHESDSEDGEERIAGEDRIAREELHTRASDLVSAVRTYVVLTVVSAVIATAGLILDSPATVVGSMVIAPLIGPSMAASIGTVTGDRELFGRAVRMQVLGIVVAVLSAALFGLGIRYLNLVPPGLDPLSLAEVNERAAPSFLVLAIAIGAGVAGIVSLMTGVSTALVGVMIAVALIPPAAAVGIGVAFGRPVLALGAGVLVTVNVLSINLSSLVTLWVEGYRPESWAGEEAARGEVLRQGAVLVLAIAAVSVVPLAITYDSFVAASTEEDIRSAVDAELETVDEQLEQRGLTVERGGFVPPRTTDHVTVRVATASGTPVPPLVERLEARIRAVTGTAVTVGVQFVFVQRGG